MLAASQEPEELFQLTCVHGDLTGFAFYAWDRPIWPLLLCPTVLAAHQAQRAGFGGCESPHKAQRRPRLSQSLWLPVPVLWHPALEAFRTGERQTQSWEHAVYLRSGKCADTIAILCIPKRTETVKLPINPHQVQTNAICLCITLWCFAVFKKQKQGSGFGTRIVRCRLPSGVAAPQVLSCEELYPLEFSKYN